MQSLVNQDAQLLSIADANVNATPGIFSWLLVGLGLRPIVRLWDLGGISGTF